MKPNKQTNVNIKTKEGMQETTNDFCSRFFKENTQISAAHPLQISNKKNSLYFCFFLLPISSWTKTTFPQNQANISRIFSTFAVVFSPPPVRCVAMKDTQSLTQSSYQVTSCNPAVEHIGNEGGKFPLSFPNVSQYFQIFLWAFLKIFPKMFLRHLFPPCLSHFPILHMFPSSCLEATFRKPTQKQLCQVYFWVDQHSFCLTQTCV